MEETGHLSFGSFRFDPQRRKLWRGDQPVDLQPKPLAVLQYLLEHPKRVVTKAELLKQVWAGVYVTTTALRVCIRALREALGDDAEQPLYIETVGREGYRFISEVVSRQHSVVSGEAGRETPDNHQRTTVLYAQGAGLNFQYSVMVGRETELALLHARFAKAMNGERQLVFVTGEPGIGKTTLVDAFLAEIGDGGWEGSPLSLQLSIPNSQPLTPHVWIGRGQCLEQYGEGEAYLPVMEALGQLCQGPDGQQVLGVLARYAPTWMMQMPALVAESELEALRRQATGATRERMLREMAEAVEALTAERALVLVLEDLHWSDRSTVELLSYLAQRRVTARVLMLGTYRPADLVLREHALKGIKQELQAHGQCEEMPLEVLTEGDVQTYVTRRLGSQGPAIELGRQVYQRTDGNPLFMVNVVEHYLQEGRLEEAAPESVQEMISRQVMRLRHEEQRMLEAGSVMGAEFVVAAVADALRGDVEALEERCERLAHTGQFLQEAGIAEWPDGTLSGRYRFRHALYQQVLYRRLGELRRTRLHRVIGERLETGYRDRNKEIAAELAMHFARGRDSERAVLYCQIAAENALRRNAHQEAIALFTRAVALLQTCPETPKRDLGELRLQVALGAPLIATKGYAAPEVEVVHLRALALCRRLEETPYLFPTLWGLWGVYSVRADHRQALDLGEQLRRLAQQQNDTVALIQAHWAVGQPLIYTGSLRQGCEELEQGWTLYHGRRRQLRQAAFTHALQDSGVNCLAMAARPLSLLGYPDRALQRCQDAVVLAQDLQHSFSLGFAHAMKAMVHHLRREASAARESAEAAIAICQEYGFRHFLAVGAIWRGWALAEQSQCEEGIAQLRQGLSAFRATSAEIALPHYMGALVETYVRAGQLEEGLLAVSEALGFVEKNNERFYEAELWRLRGELLLQKFRASGSELQRKNRVRGHGQRTKPTTTDS